MGLDIGFVQKYEWTPPPGWNFGAYITRDFDFDTLTGRLTLREIEELYYQFIETDPPATDLRRAERFVRWARLYWAQKRFGPDDGITCVQSQ